ncbi:hypothetical protein P167DRAFT_546362 [Morchella conica CCBAS932]|uniref:Uncharacterized protein n=1 Tax=Morchella conica CCBAS932 TaxID=1392247 RepID=A0A3N4KL90_9PEZI|nr:hypothetical protein P167DRAFT_546362 [Morchella conica CCBAS932]
MTQASNSKMILGILNLPKVYTSISNSLKVEMNNEYRQFKEPANSSDYHDDDRGRAVRRRSRKGKERAIPLELLQSSIMVTVVDPDIPGAFFILVPSPIYDWNIP